MLHPKIVEVSTDQKTGETYVLVHFWRTKAGRTRGDRPFLIEDFIMRLRLGGDLPAEIRANIGRFIRDAERYAYAGDNSSQAARGGAFSAHGKLVRPEGTPIQAVVRDTSDPHGVLAEPEVAALPGKDIDVAAVGP